MKKTIIAVTLAAILIMALGVAVYAEGIETTAPQWFTDMITWKKDQIKQAVDAGQLTEAQAKLYYERIDQMEKFHIQNGFPNMMGSGSGLGACGRGYNKDAQNNNINFGPGMMNGGFQMMRGRL
ncbi:MAG: hypothetical protein K0Q99_2135 [Clostridia bacterium]|jgi:hypothetical protein|nr:hypothetical protein [Clostridia bacterium]